MVEDIHMPKLLISSDLMRQSGLLHISAPIRVRMAFFFFFFSHMSLVGESKSGKEGLPRQRFNVWCPGISEVVLQTETEMCNLVQFKV